MGLQTEEEVESLVSDTMIARFPLEFADPEDDGEGNDPQKGKTRDQQPPPSHRNLDLGGPPPNSPPVADPSRSSRRRQRIRRPPRKRAARALPHPSRRAVKVSGP